MKAKDYLKKAAIDDRILNPKDLPEYHKRLSDIMEEFAKSVNLPLELTAENGAKDLLKGEFIETIEIVNPDYCGCYECKKCSHGTGIDEVIKKEVPISWDNIKMIYKKIVEHFTTQQEQQNETKEEKYYCVSSNALVYGKPCEKWCGNIHCKTLTKPIKRRQDV